MLTRLLGPIILLLSLSGCLSQAPKVAPSGVTEGGAGTGGTTTSDVALAWYQNFASSDSIAFYRDSAEHAYLRGTRVESFLVNRNDPTASYCLEIDMGASIPVSNRRYLRARAVPVSVNNLGKGTKTLYLRVDFGNPSAGTSVCARDKLEYVTDTQTQVVAYNAGLVAFTPADICVSCVSQLNSSVMRLYAVEASANRLREVRSRELDLGGVQVQLKTGSLPGSSNGCTPSSCSALGYDCCLNQQCVNDASVRPDAATSSQAFLAAEQEVLSNRLAFLKYPQFYHICGTQPAPSTTGGSSGGADPGTVAQARLAQMQADYACIQHLKAKSPATPYLLQPYSASATYDQTLCNTVTPSATMYYQSVLTRLFENCGCGAGGGYASLLANCPRFDYHVTATSAGKPVQFECRVLDETNEPDAYQTVSVPSRSVPHRFFATTGEEVDPTVTSSAGKTQEGTAFSYDDPERLRPNNGSYNMNSILGQLTVPLSGAQPAKVVEVEVDQVYMIATHSGTSTPCPSCAKDSWFASFSPAPATKVGTGLQAVGHTTERDAWGGNSPGGNYEDTIFGRACWVPPTMLPFSQPVNQGSVETQRQTRLKVQAALWANGYQRDWYGFNKGALIGSFDGVNWFAVGIGRIVRSTSNKLFLAINAPYADLNASGAHTVSVQLYDGQSTAATMDFDPAYAQGDAAQNLAGTCQAYHRCNTDSDCVTRLGWEYACADVTQLRTLWPTFNPVGAGEKLTTSPAAGVGVDTILAQGRLPDGSPKRCVYRGAGALCRTDAGNIPNTQLEKRRLLTCAPNFWCADVDSSNAYVPGPGTPVAVFNRETARMNGDLSDSPASNNHLYGRDANILGRPLDYVHSTSGATNLSQITDTVLRATIDTNVATMDASAAGKAGICRPGKRLPASTDVSTTWSPFVQHQYLDQYSRTDYINQIGACPANYLSRNKTVTCPVMDADGNYAHLTTAFSSATQTSWSKAAALQNSCGLETLKTGSSTSGTADQLQTKSPFSAIEGKPLNAQTVVAPTLVRDACLRKAGSVCHTDLDCGPNKFHAEQAAYMDDTFFGNLPNRAYYEEPLVCGQGDPKPLTTDETYDEYNTTLNRCCRPVGSSLTSYSTNEPSSVTADESASSALDPMRLGATEPTATARYERFGNVADLGGSDYPVLNAYDERNAATGVILTRTFGNPATSSGNVFTSKQWKTLDAANSKTCCGGGWIRKFADGGTDWSRTDRVQLDVTNFRCLNYLSPLIDAPDPTVWGLTSQAQIDADYGRYCSDISGATGGCAQITLQQSTNLSTAPSCASREYDTAGVNPYEAAGQAQFSTLPGEVAWTSAYNIFAFFSPASADGDPATLIDFSVSGGRRNIAFYMPSYVGSAITAVQMQRRDSSNVLSEDTCDLVGTIGVTAPTDTGACAAAGGGCCYEYDATSRLFKANINVGGANAFYDGTSSSGRYGVKITFTPPGVDTAPYAKPACTDYYYLDLLGRLELSGIPQVTHPKILCNNNSERLVPGLYDIADSTSNRSSFNDDSFAFRANLASDWHTNYHGLTPEPVFSPHDFKCCTPLGKTTKDGATCCSGYYEEYEDPTQPPPTRPNYLCKLPRGADLSVYFNRFVSNEGTNSELPGGGLSTNDFNTQTGEPLVNATVNNKLVAIGNELCAGDDDSRTRRGGAFGSFLPEPLSAANNGATVYGIVDSANDYGTQTGVGETYDVGHNAFVRGFRWNHHVYCK